METILEAARHLDYSWLPESVGAFRLVVDKELDQEANLVRYFHYKNDLGWRWDAVYDQEVQDYTVRITMPLFEFVDITFGRDNFDEFWACLQERAVQELTRLLVEPSQNFCLEYKDAGIADWDFSQAMPEEVCGFVRDIDPKHGVRMINGSYIIGEYRKMDDRSGLLLFFNMLRQEFFAELRIHNYPEINHDLDASNIEGLEAALKEQLVPILEDLESRL